MANRKASQLATATALDGTEKLYVVQGGASKQTDVGASLAALKALSAPEVANLQELAGVNPGATGLEILADATAEDVRDSISLAKPVTTKAALRALDWSKYDTFGLYENNCFRMFKTDLTDRSAVLLGPAITSLVVDPVGDGVETTADHRLQTGDAVMAPTPGSDLALNTVYFAIRLSNTVYQLATSYANAHAGVFIDITTANAITLKKHYDHMQVLYVTPDAALDGSQGALVALDTTVDPAGTRKAGLFHTDWWALSSGSNDFSPYMHAIFTAMDGLRPKGLVFDFHQYSFFERLPILREWNHELIGKGFGGCGLVKRYNETDPTRGLIEVNDWAPCIHGFSMIDLADNAEAGGACLSLKVSINDAMNGRPAIYHNQFVASRTDYSFYSSGDIFDTGGGGAPRAGQFYANYLAGGRVATISAHSMKHLPIGLNTISSHAAAGYGGPSNLAVEIDGSGIGTAIGEDLSFSNNVINGNVTVANSYKILIGGEIWGNVTIASTCTDTYVTGFVYGTVTNNTGTDGGHWISKLLRETGGRVGVANNAPEALLHVGVGADAPTLTVANGLVAYFAQNGTSILSVRDCTANVEGGITAHSAGVFIGSHTANDVQLRSNNTNRVNIAGTAGGVRFVTRPPTSITAAAAAKTVTATLTAAEVANGFITSNQGAAAVADYTLPLASAFETEMIARYGALSVGDTWDFVVTNISTNAAEIATILTAAGWTLEGNMAISPNTAATAISAKRFKIRRTGANTFTFTYVG